MKDSFAERRTYEIMSILYDHKWSPEETDRLVYENEAPILKKEEIFQIFDDIKKAGFVLYPTNIKIHFSYKNSGVYFCMVYPSDKIFEKIDHPTLRFFKFKKYFKKKKIKSATTNILINKVDSRYYDFQQQEFDYVNVESSNLSFVNFWFAKLLLFACRRSKLIFSNFRSAVLNECLFQKCNLQKALFVSSEINSTDFIQTKTNNTVFKYAYFWGCRFKLIDLSKTVFWKNNVKKCQFEQVSLQNLDLRESNFIACSFVKCDLRGIIIDSETFLTCSFKDCLINDPKIILEQSKECKVEGIICRSCNPRHLTPLKAYQTQMEDIFQITKDDPYLYKRQPYPRHIDQWQIDKEWEDRQTYYYLNEFSDVGWYDGSHEVYEPFYNRVDFSHLVLLRYRFNMFEKEICNLHPINLYAPGLEFWEEDEWDLMIRDCVFARSRLDWAVFFAVNFVRVKLTDSYLNYLDMRETKLLDVDFSGSDLTGSDFEKAHFELVNFTNANLTSCNFKDVTYEKVIFDGAILKDLANPPLGLFATPSQGWRKTVRRKKLSQWNIYDAKGNKK